MTFILLYKISKAVQQEVERRMAQREAQERERLREIEEQEREKAAERQRQDDEQRAALMRKHDELNRLLKKTLRKAEKEKCVHCLRKLKEYMVDD